MCRPLYKFRRGEINYSKLFYSSFVAAATADGGSAVAPEAESKEKHGVWDPMPELTITSPYVHSRVDYNAFTMDIGNPMPESTLTLCQSRLYPLVRDLGIWLLDSSGGE
jgi:hypothetical protein